MKQWVALLRGINVGAAGKGRKGVPMAELRELAEGLGWQDVRTYIQSGNLVFAANGSTASLESLLEQAIHGHFGFEVPVVVRPAAELKKAENGCPFTAEAEERPNLVHIGFAKARIGRGLEDDLEPYCKNGERVRVRGQCIWIDSPSGVARSKLTPAVLDRVAGSSVTVRNVKTLRAVVAMFGSPTTR